MGCTDRQVQTLIQSITVDHNGNKNKEQGYYTPQNRQPYTELLDRYMDASTAHVVAYFPAWTEGGMDLKANRFDTGGQGTQKDPGLLWFFDALSKRARPSVAETPAQPANQGKSIFDDTKK